MVNFLSENYDIVMVTISRLNVLNIPQINHYEIKRVHLELSLLQ